MENNRGLKRREPDTVDEGANTNEDPPSKRRAYKPPERARRSTGMPYRVQLASKSTSQPELSDIALPRNEYLYSPIDADSIRLLYIQPGIWSDRIRCSLETVKQSDNPTFEALSYVWGVAPKTSSILVGNAEFYVQPNLHSLLRQIRNEVQGLYVWVDAICINQNSTPEKSVQVAKIASIYRAAERTLVYLGEEDVTSNHAMNFISQIQDWEFLSQDKWLDDFGVLALAGLLNRTWFSRKWVIQEVAFAKEAIIVCGGRECHFSDLADSVDIVRSRLADIRVSFQRSPYYSAYEGLLDDLENSRSIKLLDTLKDLFLKSNDGNIICSRTNLETLVHNFRQFQTTDPRDHIYSLLSSADLSHSVRNQISGLPSWEPDYNRSNLEVFTDFVLYCARTSGSLDVIVRPWADVKRQPWQCDLVDPDLRFAVPSWIAVLGCMPFGEPKLNCKNRVNADSLVGGPSQGIYNANGGTIAEVRFGVDDARKTYTGSLFAKGIVLGEVQHLSTRMADGIVLKECLEMIGGITKDDNGTICDISDSLWRILCANRDTLGSRAPSLYRLSLLQLLPRNTCLTSLDTEDLLSSNQPKYIEDFLKRVQSVIWNRRVFRSPGRPGPDEKFMGLAPRQTQVGDKICILFGCSVPVVLRAHPRSHMRMAPRVCWELVGEAYVDGVMEGQAVHHCSANGSLSLEEEFEIQ
ncbi:heterokaryon incompatibility protein-domain-containing protein [Ustulina deusta]|nr:heterokaryon incompatibility protein-domain-containing protein [Ustulina deusta]